MADGGADGSDQIRNSRLDAPAAEADRGHGQRHRQEEEHTARRERGWQVRRVNDSAAFPSPWECTHMREARRDILTAVREVRERCVGAGTDGGRLRVGRVEQRASRGEGDELHRL